MKLYLSQIDQNFDFAQDIVAGAWCLPDVGLADKINIFEPYVADEILSMHRKLFDLSFFLLERDSRKFHEQQNRIKYKLVFQRDYVFFVFFAFSKYRVLKKIMNNICLENLEIEKVNHSTVEDFVSYFTPHISAYISYEIIKILVQDKNVTWFDRNFDKSKDNHCITKSEQLVNKKTFKQKIKESLLFSELNGVQIMQNIILTIAYKLLNLSRHLSAKNIYVPNSFDESDPEISEFISIFDSIASKFIDFNFSIHNSNNSMKDFQIKYPGFLMSKNNVLESLFCQLLIPQHGSHYATIKKHLHRELEYNSGNFLTWGKNFYSYLTRKNIINYLPYPYLSVLSDQYKFQNQNKFLWVTGVNYKAGDGLEYVHGTDVISYMKKKIALYKKLANKAKDSLIYKTLQNTELMFPDELEKIIPKNKVISDFGIIPLIKKSKIIFIDYYGTPFYEAMSMNAPVVLGLFEIIPHFTEEAKEIFDKFKKVGVVFDNPDEVANFLNYLENLDIALWWNSEKIQSVRREFLENYANNKPYFWPWLKAIIKRAI